MELLLPSRGPGPGAKRVAAMISHRHSERRRREFFGPSGPLDGEPLARLRLAVARLRGPWDGVAMAGVAGALYASAAAGAFVMIAVHPGWLAIPVGLAMIGLSVAASARLAAPETLRARPTRGP